MMFSLMLSAVVTGNVRAADQARTIIIMDGSGSMWGQIDGRPKLEIARRTLADVLKGLPADRTLGLVAYGHRRKGDCGDIELLVPPAAGNADKILSAANSMRFLGKTPLSEAVRKAAEELRSTETAATVVLITDGLETCSGDPCALARELERSGVDFTAHVVGFGLSREDGKALSCLARETGGQYIDARNGAALREALNKTIAAKPAETQQAKADLPPPPEATLEAPETAGRAAKVSVAWTGPARDGDYIDIAPFDGAGAASISSAPVSEGQDRVELTMPAEPGSYILRYMQPLNDQERASLADGLVERSLALRAITVVDVDKFLNAPETAAQGAPVEIAWGGPGGDKDYVGLYGESGALIDDWINAVDVSQGNPLKLQVPAAPGSYELRYIVRGANDQDVLVRKPITVVAASALLDFPDKVRPGSKFPVRWSGPAGPRDWVDLVKSGEDAVSDYEDFGYFYVENSAESRVDFLTAPEEPGTYEIRYVTDFRGRERSTAILGRQTLTVSPDAPEIDASGDGVSAEAE